MHLSARHQEALARSAARLAAAGITFDENTHAQPSDQSATDHELISDYESCAAESSSVKSISELTTFFLMDSNEKSLRKKTLFHLKELCCECDVQGFKTSETKKPLVDDFYCGELMPSQLHYVLLPINLHLLELVNLIFSIDTLGDCNPVVLSQPGWLPYQSQWFCHNQS